MEDKGLFTSVKADELLRLLAGHKTEKHTYKDKGYDFLDVGQYFVTVKNPEGTNNLSVKIGNEFTLFFAGCQKEYSATEEGFAEMVKVLQAIIDCSLCVYALYTEGSSRFTIGRILKEKELNDRMIKELIYSCQEFRGIKFRNVKLRLIAWQTEYNKEVGV